MDTSSHGTAGLASSSHSAGRRAAVRRQGATKPCKNPRRLLLETASRPLSWTNKERWEAANNHERSWGRGPAGSSLAGAARGRHLIPGAVHEPTAPDVTTAAGGSGGAGDAARAPQETAGRLQRRAGQKEPAAATADTSSALQRCRAVQGREDHKVLF